jgi:hypothetical protein
MTADKTFIFIWNSFDLRLLGQSELARHRSRAMLHKKQP